MGLQGGERREVGLHMPGVAAGGATARLVGFQHHHAHAVLGQAQGQGRPDQPGADHDHVCLYAVVQRRVGRGLPWQRPATEANGHHTRLIRGRDWKERNLSRQRTPIFTPAHCRLLECNSEPLPGTDRGWTGSDRHCLPQRFRCY
ncbi:hypothetical protein D9M68_855790 [compost metagenome]